MNRSHANSPSLEVKPAAQLLALIESAPVSCPNAVQSDSASTISLPNFPAQLDATANFNRANIMKRSSSVCDAIAVVDCPPLTNEPDANSFDSPSEASNASAMEIRGNSPADDIMSSPSKSLPLFTGFAQLGSDLNSDRQGDNTKQFFF